MATNEEDAKILFTNGIINKRQLKNLMYCTFHNYGVVKSSIIADKVKNLTFHYATKSGISLSIEDLRVPQKKRSLMGLTNNEVETTEQNYEVGNITNIERFQKVIDIWNNASNFLKEEVVTYFRESDPFNSLYIMAFSGARGNISQVRQLVGMRGLMADPQGQIIDLPIKSNFREGLTVTEYIISSYGARKGLVDTALRTADSGYLTRRLVDVAQDIIVREEDCYTQDGLLKNELINETSPNLSVKDRMIGRLLAEPLIKKKDNVILPINTQLTSNLLDDLHELDIEKLKVRSPLTCTSIRSICRNCYGWHLAYSKLVDLGEAIGIIAAQSIGEPGTQLTMRTFHTGGVFSGDLTQQIRAPFQGTLSYKTAEAANLVRTLHGTRSFLIKESVTLYIQNLKGACSKIRLPEGATLLSNTGQKVYTNQIIAEIKKDANLVLEEDSKTVYTNISGEVFFQNINIETIIDKQGNSVQKNRNPGLIWVLYGKRYSLPRSSELVAKLGQINKSGSIIAKKSILNSYSGIVKFDEASATNEIKILNFSLILQNANILIKRNTAKEEKNILKLKSNYVNIEETGTLLKEHCKSLSVNNEIFMEEIVKFIGLDSDHYGDVKDCYECKDYTYQVMYKMPHHEDKLDSIKNNMIASLLTFDKELIHGNAVLFKTYISIDNPEDDLVIDTQMTDVINLLMNNKYHTGVYVDSKNKFKQIYFNNKYDIVDPFNNWVRCHDTPNIIKHQDYGFKYHDYLKFKILKRVDVIVTNLL